MRIDYFVRRALSALLVIAGVVTLTFFVVRLVPSDPARLYAGARARPAQLAAIRSQLGLDRPLVEQYVRYVASLLRGDLGDSLKTKRSVRIDLSLFLPATLELVICAYLLALLAGIPAGVLAGATEGSGFDRLTGAAAILGAAAPVFALALLAQQLFFNHLHWLPLNGRMSAEVSINHPVTTLTGFWLLDTALTGNWVAWRDVAAHLLLPVLVLAVYPLAIILRMTRAAMIEALHQPHIIVVRAKGLHSRTIVRRHALRNAILPVLTVAGLSFAYAITGSILVEALFRWPGVGLYVADAIASKDFPPILAVTLVSTILFVGVTFAVDLLRALLDPRVQP
jgi:peptide/nickel transport system permease protein